MYEKEKLDALKAKVAAYNEKTQASLAKRPERYSVFETGSGEPVNRLYTPLDIETLDYERDLGIPGQFPYTRGVQPTMYRGQL